MRERTGSGGGAPGKKLGVAGGGVPGMAGGKKGQGILGRGVLRKDGRVLRGEGRGGWRRGLRGFSPPLSGKPWKPSWAPSAKCRNPDPAPCHDPDPAPVRALAQDPLGAAGGQRGAHEGESAPSRMRALRPGGRTLWLEHVERCPRWIRCPVDTHQRSALDPGTTLNGNYRKETPPSLSNHLVFISQAGN